MTLFNETKKQKQHKCGKTTFHPTGTPTMSSHRPAFSFWSTPKFKRSSYSKQNPVIDLVCFSLQTDSYLVGMYTVLNLETAKMGNQQNLHLCYGYTAHMLLVEALCCSSKLRSIVGRALKMSVCSLGEPPYAPGGCLVD